MRAKMIKLNIHSSFEDFCDNAPKELQCYVDRCAQTPQSATWHPEGDVKTHTRIVFNRAKKSKNFNLMIAAFFHDLGKADVTRKHPFKPDAWSAYGHEYVSAKLVEKYRDWIEEIGGDFEIVFYIVKEHMRAKLIDNMRPSKRAAVISHPYYSLMQIFNECDNMQTLTLDEID